MNKDNLLLLVYLLSNVIILCNDFFFFLDNHFIFLQCWFVLTVQRRNSLFKYHSTMKNSTRLFSETVLLQICRSTKLVNDVTQAME